MTYWGIQKLGNRKAALIMSVIFPGLGQIYKREVMKGVTFIMICALLVISLFFLLPPPPFLYFLGLSILALMWLMGMFDAYIDDEFLRGRERWLFWRRVLSILPLAIITVAIIALIMLWLQDFSAQNERLVASASLKPNPIIGKLTDASIDYDNEIDAQPGNSEHFSVQVASFKDLERADNVYWDLRAKKYTVAIEQSKSGGEVWHRVLVGKFSVEQDATSFIETLQKREGFSNMIVRRRSAEIK